MNNVIRSASSFTAQVRNGNFDFTDSDLNYNGSETQKFNVGDLISSSDLSTMRFNNEKILEVYNQCGHFYYVINIGKYSYAARTKDIRCC